MAEYTPSFGLAVKTKLFRPTTHARMALVSEINKDKAGMNADSAYVSKTLKGSQLERVVSSISKILETLCANIMRQIVSHKTYRKGVRDVRDHPYGIICYTDCAFCHIAIAISIWKQ